MRKRNIYKKIRKGLLIVCMLLLWIVMIKNSHDSGSFVSSGIQDRQTVLLCRCVDGDTAVFLQDNQEIKVRFLAINTPELSHGSNEEEPFAKDASDYTCERLKQAKSIVLQYDSKAQQTDKYGRSLAWVWVDDELLQQQLVRKGYAKVAYLYDDYLYTSQLQKAQKEAQRQKIGLWQGE